MPFGATGTAAAAAGGHEYVDRGDPAASDWDHEDLDIDSGWHDLDCSAIVTDNDAVLIHMRVTIKDATPEMYIQFRKNGNTNTVNASVWETQVANINFRADLFVACDDSQVIEYCVETGMDIVYIGIRGWFKPA